MEDVDSVSLGSFLVEYFLVEMDLSERSVWLVDVVCLASISCETLTTDAVEFIKSAAFSESNGFLGLAWTPCHPK